MEVHGWSFYHSPDNSPRVSKSGKKYVQNVKAGWPDLFAVKGPTLLAAELKREEGKTKPEQDEWLEKLAGAGVEVFVWRPSDLAEVQTILGRISPEKRDFMH